MSTSGYTSTLSDVSNAGVFVRKPTDFHNKISREEGNIYQPEADRYHLYISLACPWACRCLLVRKLKGLESIIGVSVVHPLWGPHGWTFENPDNFPDCVPDDVNGFAHAKQLYQKVNPEYDGRVTVPILWCKKTSTIVNNESSEIIRMFNEVFNDLIPCDDKRGKAAKELCLYPPSLREEIEKMNELVYPNVNNGVYRCGFATTQTAYEAAYDALFGKLDFLDRHLAHHRFLVGGRFTEADVRLFVTLIRFDVAYYGHFKCNHKHIWEYPNILAYTSEIYQMEGVAGTVNFPHIKTHYYGCHGSINPTGVVPRGPSNVPAVFLAPHGRETMLAPEEHPVMFSQ
eukprot:TRINITY_DN482_c4_g1_i1.p1 TRINITY_DN482_c4_g1~~TRINITY_DN482_c4_g1_i1.p1  ORF type:complete len:351 (-),score=49.50 TRINITY_DN482_c4_g1_i1:136-1164(-)